MFTLILLIVVIFLSILFRITGALRLSIPLLYALIVPTVFHEWYYAHSGLATGIWYAMLGLVAVSWVLSIAQRIRG